MIKLSITCALFVNKINNNAIVHVSLLMTAYMVKVEGLCYDLSWAWKSGKKPSPIKEQIKNILPIEKSESG